MIGRRSAASILAVLIPATLIGSFAPYPVKLLFGTPLRHVAIPGISAQFNLHGAMHVALFGAIAWLLLKLFTRTRSRIVDVVCVAAMALSIEMAETLQSGIHVEWSDVEADLLGVVLAIAITLSLRARAGSANREAPGK